MKNMKCEMSRAKRTGFMFVFLLFAVVSLFATPSAIIWTPCTTSIQAYLKGQIDYDTYVRDTSMLPVDYGFTVGVLPFSQVQAEIGYDALLPVFSPQTFKDANYFNAKIGTPEGTLLPIGFTAGIFDLGIDSNVTNFNVFHAEIGKTFDYVGNICIGGYTGNDKLLINDNGKVNNSGFMASWTSVPFGKFSICADYMSGNNALSAFSVAGTATFADNATLLTGPVFPLSKQYAGSSKMLWTVQASLDFDIIPPAPAPAAK